MKALGLFLGLSILKKTNMIKNNKLIKHTGLILQCLQKTVMTSMLKLKVSYNFSENLSLIYLDPVLEKINSENSYYYDWELIEKLIEVSNKYKISYKIGIDNEFRLHIQIFV
jgi:hypothetical protein